MPDCTMIRDVDQVSELRELGMSDKPTFRGDAPKGEVVTKTRAKTQRPSLYKVLLLNDDYTTMDFVVEVLETIFNKQPAEAFRIMMMVHTQGRGLCGVYPYEIAETKVEAVINRARDNGFPLKAAMEPE
jgi:ATP-dependent Clp protease adaptor protein ClpS